ncbi:NPC1-like intracellular cholesterol transporter 1 [Dermacentor variabilis]|uniref:NPC1-like intracellular cholesterol transporter 1 n=1 Tax=Dermacentor variabilis TaxID=34621 RepID=UPI003F5CB9D8
MSSSWLFTVAVSVTLVSSALSQCVTYGYCGTDGDSGKPLPCAVKRDPVPIESSILKDACPALIDSSDKSVPACCDAKQAASFKSELKSLVNLGVKKTDPCFRNFQNLVCQAFCSPKQSAFVAINGTSSEGSDQPSATESVYAVHKTFAEKVYDACKGIRTYIFWTKLMSYMCGKHGASGCSAQRFLDFVGSVYSEGGYSPIKIRHVLTEGPITVAGQKLEAFNPKFL